MEAMKGWRGTRNYYPFTALKLLPRSFRGIEDIVKPTYYDLSCQFPEAGISRGEARKSMTRVTPLFGFPFLKHRRKFNLVRLPRQTFLLLLLFPLPPPRALETLQLRLIFSSSFSVLRRNKKHPVASHFCRNNGKSWSLNRSETTYKPGTGPGFEWNFLSKTGIWSIFMGAMRINISRLSFFHGINSQDSWQN